MLSGSGVSVVTGSGVSAVRFRCECFNSQVFGHE